MVYSVILCCLLESLTKTAGLLRVSVALNLYKIAIIDRGTCFFVDKVGFCTGYDAVLAPGERCLSATTRNFKGRMGSPEADIFLGSPTTVTASAIAGKITDPREVM